MRWYHLTCAKLLVSQVKDIHTFHCFTCAARHGPLVLRRKSKRTRTKIDYIALDKGDVFAVDKEVHPHVLNFLTYTSDPSKIDTTDDLTAEYAWRTRLEKPVLVSKAATRNVGGMSFPKAPKSITIDYIAECVGEDMPVEVMDVLSQQGAPGWTMGRWREYFKTDKANRDRIRNVISLEISQIEGLGREFVRPKMVRDLDLVDKVWDDSAAADKPQVSTYCLMSVLGSYTDFHIDFGGTSVYYTVCSGSKTFLMFPPTGHNLDLYQSWCLEENQNYLWFPEYTRGKSGSKPLAATGGFAVTLSPGDLFIIPSGWIHAVYTPVDSIVIGGNFLTMMNLGMQVLINQIERATKVPPRFRFPHFNRVLWLTAAYLVFKGAEKAVPNRNNASPTTIKDDPELSPQPHQPIADVSRTGITVKLDTKKLHDHLCWHYKLSKDNKVARSSIPTAAISKDIPQFLEKFALLADADGALDVALRQT